MEILVQKSCQKVMQLKYLLYIFRYKLARETFNGSASKTAMVINHRNIDQPFRFY